MITENGKRRLIFVLQVRHQHLKEIQDQVRLFSESRANEISFHSSPETLLSEVLNNPKAENAVVVIGNADGCGDTLAQKIKNKHPKSLILMYSVIPPLDSLPHIDGYIKKQAHLPPKVKTIAAKTTEISGAEGEDPVVLTEPEKIVEVTRIDNPDDIAVLLCYIRQNTTLPDLLRCFKIISSTPQ